MEQVYSFNPGAHTGLEVDGGERKHPTNQL